MGYIYLRGISTKELTIEPDTLKSVSWYKQAVKNKVPEAAAVLGRLYINGIGIERDTDRGFQLLNESANSGHLNSKLYLGYCYLYGLGVDQNTKHARILFQNYFDSFSHSPDQRVIIVDNRVIDLDYLLGLTYYYENSSECIPLFEMSLKSKSFVHSQRSDILLKLASCYRNGTCGQQINHSKANNLRGDSQKYGNYEINAENVIL